MVTNKLARWKRVSFLGLLEKYFSILLVLLVVGCTGSNHPYCGGSVPSWMNKVSDPGEVVVSISKHVDGWPDTKELLLDKGAEELLFQKSDLSGTVELETDGKVRWGKRNGKESISKSFHSETNSFIYTLGGVTVRVNAKNFYCDSNNIGHLWLVDLSGE